MANEYVSAATLKATLSITTTSSDADLTAACSAASRAIEEACLRKFWLDSVDQTRVYTHCPTWPGLLPYWQVGMSTRNTLEIDDLTTLTSLKVDMDGDGVYETTWIRGTDFYMDPPNAPNDSYPWERVVIINTTAKYFPSTQNGVQIVGKFGWPAVPPQVTEYAGILAAQLYLRSRQAPFGVISAGVEIGSTTRIARYDPDFERLLGNIAKPPRRLA